MSGNLEPGRHACSAQVDAVIAHRNAFPNQEVALPLSHGEGSVGADDAIAGDELNFWRENHVSSARERCFCRQKLRNHRTLAPLPSLVPDQLVDSVFQVPRALATPDEVQQRLVLGVEILDARPLALPPVACAPNAPQDHSFLTSLARESMRFETGASAAG